MEPFIGEIKIFAGKLKDNFPPRGWAFCEGQVLSISQNTELFSLLGTIYGGDGRTTFALPDLRGRVGMGQGQGPRLSSYQLGQKKGDETVTLTTQNLPYQSLKLRVATNGTTVEDASASSHIGGSGNTTSNGLGTKPVSIFKDSATSFTELDCITSEGGQQSFNLHSPYLVVNYIIALEGIFPSRN